MNGIMDKLRDWKISVAEMNGNIRYSSAIAGQPTAEQLGWIRENKPAILDGIRERLAVKVATIAAAPPDAGVTLPPAYLPNGEPHPDLWPSLAARLVLEAPEAERRALRDSYARRLAFWRETCDAPRMAYVDLECEVAERWGRILAVCFTPTGAVRAEGIGFDRLRPAAPEVEVAPEVFKVEKYGKLFAIP